MRRILRRYLTRDPAGRPVSLQSERLTDDGAGRMQLNSETTARCCSGCGRLATDLDELRGVCDWCNTRECCVHCVSRCQVCARQLCGSCRHGFAGPPAMTVCATCQQRLISRQMYQDRLTLEQAAFDRRVAEQRLFNQAEALRLASERMQIMARFQAARLGMDRQSPLRWTMNLLGRSMVRTYQYVQRALQ